MQPFPFPACRENDILRCDLYYIGVVFFVAVLEDTLEVRLLALPATARKSHIIRTVRVAATDQLRFVVQTYAATIVATQICSVRIALQELGPPALYLVQNSGHWWRHTPDQIHQKIVKE